MTTHIPDSKLELFFLDSSQLGIGESSDIEKHISQCSVCRENFEKVKDYYSFIEENINKDGIDDSLTAEKILRQNNQISEDKLLTESKAAVTVLHGDYEIIEHKKNSLTGWIKDFVRYNPLKFSGSLALVGIIAALLLYYNKPEMKFVNPSLAVVEKNVLYVYNETGDLLWKKGAPGMENYRTDYPRPQNNVRELLLDDLDNDGINELLITGNYHYNGLFASDTIYCFDSNGDIKWKYGCGGFANVQTSNWRHTRWLITDYFITRSKSEKRLFVIAGTNYAPAKIFELDFNSGKIKQEFYNSGGITASTLFDIDDDGYEEIILGGINNGFGRAFVALFEPDNVKGFSPSTEMYIPDSLQKNSAIKYILFPTTNFMKALSFTDYNAVTQFLMSKVEKTITVYVKEVVDDLREHDGQILYNFNTDWELLGVVLADNFIANYNRLLKTGEVKEPLDTNYTRALAGGVKYLK